MKTNTCFQSIIVFLTMSSLVLADVLTDSCSSDDIPGWPDSTIRYTNKKIIDVDFNGIIKTFKMQNVNQITDYTNQEFFNASYNALDQLLYVSATGKKFNESTTGNMQTVTIIFQCKSQNEQKLVFWQEINNTNYFAPVFSKESYNFKVPLPLHPGWDLTEYQEISAIDYDITYNKITFYSNDLKDIKVGTVQKTVGDKKRYYATLNVTKGLNSIPENLEFTIYAKDNGDDIGGEAKISSAKINISANAEKSFPPQPRFQKILYTGSLNDKYELIINDEVTLYIGTYSEQIIFNKTGNDEKLFKIEQKENIITIKLSDKIVPEDLKNKKYLQFEIFATNPKINETGRTGVIIDFPLQEIHFDKISYIGKMNNDDTLNLQDIQLIGEIDEELKFILNDYHAQYFRVIKIDENFVKIQLKDNVNITELNEYKFLTMTINAVRNEINIASASIIIDIERGTDLVFSKSIYEGKFNDFTNFTMEEIELLEISYTESVTFHFEEKDMKYFNYTRNNNTIKINFNGTIYPEEWKLKKFLLFFITAKKSKVSDQKAGILIHLLDQKITELEIPEFEKTLYKGKIISKDQIEIEKINLINPIKNIQYILYGNESEYFKFDETKNEISVENTIPADIFQNKKYISLILNAITADDISNFTTIILEPPVPVSFTKILYKGLINEKLELSIEDIKFVNDINLKYIFIDGKDDKYFQVNVDKLNVIVELKQNLTEDDIRDRKYFEYMIVAVTEEETLAETIVLVDIEIDSSSTTEPSVTTTEPSVTTTEASTSPPTTTEQSTKPTLTTTEPTTQNPSPTGPQFAKTNYVFTIYSNQIGIFGIVSLDQTENIQIQYKLEITDDHANARIIINKITGELYLTGDINPGIYYFEATAKTNISSDLARTIIQLKVNSINICGNNSQVQNSLLIKNLAEEEIHYDILQMKQNDCIFKIIDMKPNDRAYFHINETTNMLNSIVIDREDPIFANLHIVQIQLKLVLSIINTEEYNIPTNILNHKYITTNFIQPFNNLTDEPQYILTNGISFDPSVTILSIIINDINDNRPEFIIPLKSKIFIGYPDSEISEKILPEYLIKVSAIDKDIGLNSLIRYQLPTNNHFGIDEKTGIIYPYSNALKNIDETILNVYAIDRDGAPDGLKSSVEIIVKKLNSHHLVLLTFESVNRNEINNILKNISSDIGLNLINLNHAIVPSEEKSSITLKYFNNFLSRADKTSTIVLKTWVYSLGKENLPIDAAVLKERISQGHQNSDVKVESYEDARNSTKNNKIQLDITGYIVAISILSVVSISFIGFLVWIYYLREIIYKRLSSSSLDKLPQFTKSLEPNAIYQTEMEKSESPLSSYLKRESVKISGTTTQETSSDSSEYQKQITEESKDEISVDSTISDSDTETPSNVNAENLEKRKSIVTFNELVERIDIESEDDDTKHSNSIRL